MIFILPFTFVTMFTVLNTLLERMTQMGKTSQEVLAAKVAEAKKLVEVGALYYHYKDPAKQYRVTAVGLFEETEEVMVSYQALYGAELLWHRKLNVWLSKAQTDQGEVQRFQKSSVK
jgi:hypothetical protein